MTVLSDPNPNPRSSSSRGGLGSYIRLWMLAVGLVPLLSLFLFGYWTARSALIEASDEHLLSVVGARRAQIEAWLAERLTDIEVISGSQDCITLVKQAEAHERHADVCRYLDSFQTGARDYKVLALYDLDWHWVASHTGARDHSEPLIDSDLKRELASATGPVMTPVHDHAALGTGFHVAGTLHQPGEPPVGYVVAALDLTGTFAPILADRAGLGRTGRVYLADRRGRILVSGAPDLKGKQAPELVLEPARTKVSGVAHLRSTTGKKTYVGYTGIPGRDWVLIAEMDQNEALGLLEPLRRGFLIAGLLTLIAVVVLSSRSSRRLSAPLAELARAARRIQEGNPGIRVPTLPGREVAEVGRAFNEMLDALEEIQRQRVQAGALAAVGELSSSMVHEIRNRLSSVKMNVQALEKRVHSEETYGELARIALEQVHRTEETLTDLLNYARPMEPKLRRIDLGELLASLAARFGAEAADRGTEVFWKDDTDGAHLTADPKLMEEALSNLLRNAMEAAGEGGQVRLRAHRSTPGWIALDVEDDGPGFGRISPEDLFKPFFTTKERGAGLGLAHTRKIAEIHGGRIRAMAGASGGSMFRLEFPEQEVSE